MESLATNTRIKTGRHSHPSSSSDVGKSCKKLKTGSVTNGFLSSVRSTEREQKMNRNKFRIRSLPESPDECTNLVVIEALNSTLSTNLTTSDIISCERVKRWESVAYPRDIVVTFVDECARDDVYYKKMLHSSLPFEIMAELCPERAQIFAEAVNRFGERNVFNVAGLIHIITRRKHRHAIRTMWEFRTFLRKISSEMRSEPDLKMQSSDEYSSDSSEELWPTFYGPKRENRNRLQKKLRIRKVPEFPDENTKFEAFQYIYTKLNIELDVSDIESCERVVGWDGCSDPRDIVVTFKYSYLQQNVLYSRKNMANGRTEILEELTPKAAEIWGEAVKMYGEDNVYVASNVVSINLAGRLHPIVSMIDFERIVKEYPYLTI